MDATTGMKMKHLKQLFAAALAMFVAFAIAVPAFAAGTGSITITPPDGVDEDATITYNIYKVFDADGNGTAISYKVMDGKTGVPAGFTVDAAGNVTYAGTGTELTDTDIAAIAAYVEGDTPVATVTSTGGADAVASNLPNGYYYITTTTGTVVTIDSTNPDAKVDDKNVVPGIDKTIGNYDSYDAQGKNAIAEVGKVVTYTVKITVGKGQTGYVMKDTLGTGLEYVDGSLAVTGMTAEQDYKLTVDGQNITVKFEDDAVKAFEGSADGIVVTYKATVTSAALQDNPAKNTATISYGNNSQYTSEPSVVNVYNAEISVLKTDGEDKPLAGAGFVLKNADGKYYTFANNAVTWVDDIEKADEHVSGTDGKVPAFNGLANGKYTLVEKTVPSGYNKAADQDITIKEADVTAGNLKQSATVINKSGSVLPSTGGMGTTIFYVIGGALVITAGVLLVTKRRMAGIEA